MPSLPLLQSVCVARHWGTIVYVFHGTGTVSDLLSACHEGRRDITPLVLRHGTSHLYHRSFYLLGKSSHVLNDFTSSAYSKSTKSILVNNQLDAQYFVYVYFYSIHVSGSHVSIMKILIVSMRHLVYVTLKQVNSLKLQKVMP